ncbi:uncharacterized protein [Panulirus ornatus]|uniref:uncharacterized protein n=1 Tax=Panulirus ornatus TaxID=150431 RepID=UPI003A87F813
MRCRNPQLILTQDGRDVLCEEDVAARELVHQLLGSASSLPADCGSPTTRPPWLDTAKLKRGQAVFHRYFLSVFVANLVGLVCILAVESILKVLVFTGRSSTVTASFKRYLGTLNHVRVWYTADVFDPDSSAFKSIQLVRRMHTTSHKDAKKAGVAIATQTDMVVTQWAFFGLVLTHGQYLGLSCSREEEESLVHFWKSVGYLLGIEDRFNLGSGELEEVRAKCKAVLEVVIVAGLTRPPHHFSTMTDVMLQGVHMIIPAVDPPAFLAFTYHLLGLHHDTTNLSWCSTFILNFMIWVFRTVLHIPIIGKLTHVWVNSLLRFALFVCNSLPSVASFYRWAEKSLASMIDSLIAYSTKVQNSVLLLFNLQNNKC